MKISLLWLLAEILLRSCLYEFSNLDRWQIFFFWFTLDLTTSNYHLSKLNCLLNCLLTYLRALVLDMLVCLRICVVGVLPCLRARVFAVLRCSRNRVLRFLSNYFFYVRFPYCKNYVLANRKLLYIRYKCMLTDISLKVYILIDNNKFHENCLRNIIYTLMPKNPKWSDTLSKSCSEWSLIWL